MFLYLDIHLPKLKNNPMVTALQNKLQALIGNAKTQQALDVLTTELQGTNEGDTITLLRARWNRNQQSYNLGVLNNSDYQMEMNRINYALLSVIGDLEESSPSVQASPIQQKAEAAITNIYNTYIMGDKVEGNKTTTVIHGDNIGGDKVMGNKMTDNRTNHTTNNPAVAEVKKKTILFIAANPAGKNETNSGRESQTIQSAINNGSLRDQYEVQINFASNVNELLRLLKKFKPTIVHLSMHGATTKGMLFEDGAGNVDYVSEDVLASFFELVNIREKVVECVILNACNSVTHAEVVNQYVDYTVGMNGPIPPDVAIKYTEGFYESILEGDDYETAHRSSVSLLNQYAKKLDWNGDVAIKDMPKLFSPKV